MWSKGVVKDQNKEDNRNTVTKDKTKAKVKARNEVKTKTEILPTRVYVNEKPGRNTYATMLVRECADSRTVPVHITIGVILSSTCDWERESNQPSQNVPPVMLFIHYTGQIHTEKQQKGAFYINGYQVELVGSLRKDAKKNACFELKAPGQRTYQFTANTAKEAKEWVDQINFVLKDISSTQIPYDDGEEDMEESQISQGNEDQEEETYDDIDAAISPNTAHNSFSSQSVDGPFEDEEDNDIYEELPDEEFPLATSGEGCGNKLPSGESSVDYANYYQGMWDCTGDQSDELSFKRGDLIYILSKKKNWYEKKDHEVEKQKKGMTAISVIFCVLDVFPDCYCML
ncbi:SKAP1 protein, partial [Polypterus senegalus]